MILTSEQIMIRDTARAFAQKRLRPGSAAWEEQGALPREVVREMGALGLLGLLAPAEWDGAGAGTIAFALAVEEIAAGDGACSTIVCGHNSVGCGPVLRHGTQGQKERFLRPMAKGEMVAAFCLSEAQAGSDASRLQTRAVRENGGWRIRGTKMFISSGKTADVALIFAVTDPDAGKRGISCFIIPTATPGYEVVRIERKMGQNASDTCEINLDLHCPDDAMLGAPGDGYGMALDNLECGRIGVAAQAIGMARAAFEIALQYAGERITFGKPIIEHQAVSFRLAEMATAIEAARQLYLHAASIKDQGLPCLKEASMAKLFATESAEKICSDAIQTLGGYGYMRDFGVERIFRAVRVCKIYEGTNDIQRMVIGRLLNREIPNLS